MRILVTGVRGQVARSLQEAAEADPEFSLRCMGRPQLDLTRPDTISSAIEAFEPDLIVNPAAYTGVDKAESEAELAFAINRDGAGAVAAAAANAAVPIIHLSTDYVFDGRKDGPYVEDDAVGPDSVYGRSKLDGERAVLAANQRSIILRTSWVFAPYGSNFVRTMVRLATERDRLRVVDDQVGCPTYAPDIADAILAIARRMQLQGWRDAYGGVTHLAGPEAISWCGFANKVFAAAALRGFRAIPVDAITTAEFPTAARRPANSRLSTTRLASIFDVRLPTLDHAIDRCLDRLTAEPDVAGGPAQ